MTFAELKYLVYSDLYRVYGRVGLGLLLYQLILGVTGKYLVWMRVASWLSARSLLWVPVFVLVRLLIRRYSIKYGINIAYQAAIGPGLSLAHFGGINVNPRVKIGRNCNLSQEVTIGISNRGPWKGVPTIGDNVYIGPGAKLFGAIRVGDNAAIGANCVVVEDVPDNAVVFGVPARILTYGGSGGYINRTDYDRLLKPATTGGRIPADTDPSAAAPQTAGDQGRNGHRAPAPGGDTARTRAEAMPNS